MTQPPSIGICGGGSQAPLLPGLLKVVRDAAESRCTHGSKGASSRDEQAKATWDLGRDMGDASGRQGTEVYMGC